MVTVPIDMISILFGGLVLGMLIGLIGRRRGSATSKDVYKPGSVKLKPKVYIYVNGAAQRLKGKMDWSKYEFIAKNGRRYLINPDHIMYMPSGLIRRVWKPVIFVSPEGSSIQPVQIDIEKGVKHDVGSKLVRLLMYANAAEAYQEVIKHSMDVATKRMMYAVAAMSLAMIVVTALQYMMYSAAIGGLEKQFEALFEWLRNLAPPPVPGG